MTSNNVKRISKVCPVLRGGANEISILTSERGADRREAVLWRDK